MYLHAHVSVCACVCVHVSVRTNVHTSSLCMCACVADECVCASPLLKMVAVPGVLSPPNGGVQGAFSVVRSSGSA